MKVFSLNLMMLVMLLNLFMSGAAWSIRGGDEAESSQLVRDGHHAWMQGVVKLMAVHVNTIDEKGAEKGGEKGVERGEKTLKYVCTGTIIDRDVVLTSAHCFDTGHRQWQILVNDQAYAVIDIGIHKHYRREEVFDAYWNYLLEIRLHNDLALVRTEQPFPKNQTEVLDLAFDHSVIPSATESESVYMVGFGQTEHLFGIGEGEGVLRVAGPVQFLANSTQRIDFKNLPMGACLGDSGAPLLLRSNGKIQVAAVLSQSDCLGNSTYQYVAKHHTAINEYNWAPLEKHVAVVVKE